MPFVSVDVQSRSILQPWEISPYRFISWWEMENFSAHVFFSLGSYLRATELKFKSVAETPIAPGAHKGAFEDTELKQMFAGIRILCANIGLTISVKLIDQLVDPAKEPGTSADVAAMFAQIEDTIRLE